MRPGTCHRPFSYLENAMGAGDKLLIADGAKMIGLTLLEGYSPKNFSVVSDRPKGTRWHICLATSSCTRTTPAT